MIAALMVFVLVVGVIVGAYVAWQKVPRALAEQKLGERLREVSTPVLDTEFESSVVRQELSGPIPALDDFVGRRDSMKWLPRLVEQSGVQTTASSIIAMSVGLAIVGGLVASLTLTLPLAAPLAALIGGMLPVLFLVRRRSRRVAKFEEMFPEALDLMARAIRAGHAFQTSLGMVAEELKDPVGPEFKKTFEQQNFGLPVREALDGLAARVPLIDVRFFVTAVAIQRESGGNLSEILENLAHVVRERFKIRRQVRIHTAHGRFTGYVLLALPACLALALSYIVPEQMQLLFTEPMGRMMLMGAIVLQIVGFVWIKQVIKIEV